MTAQETELKFEFDTDRLMRNEMAVDELYEALVSLRGSWKLQYPLVKCNCFVNMRVVNPEEDCKLFLNVYAFDIQPGPVAQIKPGGVVSILDATFVQPELLQACMQQVVRDTVANRYAYHKSLNEMKAPPGFVALGERSGQIPDTPPIREFSTGIQRGGMFNGILPGGESTEERIPPMTHVSGMNPCHINREWLEWRALQLNEGEPVNGTLSKAFCQAVREAKEHVIRNNPILFKDREDEVECVPFSSSLISPYLVRIKKEHD